MLGGRKGRHLLSRLQRLSTAGREPMLRRGNEVSVTEAGASPVKGQGKDWFAMMPGQ